MHDVHPTAFGLGIVILDGEGHMARVRPCAQRDFRRIASAMSLRRPKTEAGWTVAIRPFGQQRKATLPALAGGVAIALHDRTETCSIELDATAFAPWARDVMATLLMTSSREGSAPPPEPFSYYLAVLDGELVASDQRLGPFHLPPLPSIAAEPPAATTAVLGAELDLEDDLPVYVRQESLIKALDYCTTEHGTVEKGGVLFGRLCRHDEQLFVSVEHFAAAVGAPADAMTMRWDHTAWSAITRARASLGPSQMCVGWLHSHPSQLTSEGELVRLTLRPSMADTAIVSAWWAWPYHLCFIVDPDSPSDRADRVAIFGWDRNALALRQRGVELF